MPPRQGAIKVDLEGRGPLTLYDGNYIDSGGEASIYRAHGTSIKLYTDPAKMRRDGMEEKIKLLRALKSPYIMAPEGVVRNAKGQAVGIYMPYAEGLALPKIFTTAFRQRESFGDPEATAIVDRMRGTVQFVHGHGAVMVDGNELNWIADLRKKGSPEPRAIDVDSWAVGRFGATVVMPSIRDWHTKGFTDLSDWFSWGVVTFQIFTGIHPYRGTLDGYKPGDLERRMRDNASVFSPKISLNRVVRDFNAIPAALREWYEAVFQKGERSVPPSPYDKGVAQVARYAQMHRTVVTTSGSLIYEKLFEVVGDAAVRIWPCGAALLASGKVIDLRSKRQIGELVSRDGELIRVEDGWVLADWVSGQTVFTFVDERTRVKTPLPLTLNGRHLMRYENRLFLVTDQDLAELGLMTFGRPLLSVVRRTSVLALQATKWFDGVGIQEAFGAKFAVLPFGERSCITVRLRELDGIVPVAAKAGNRFVSIIGLDQSRSYQKFEITFTGDYSNYTVWRGGTDSSDLNVAILPKGVCATILNDGELDIFVPTSGKVNHVQDRQIATDMLLSNWEDQVVYLQNGAVWSLKMK